MLHDPNKVKTANHDTNIPMGPYFFYINKKTYKRERHRIKFVGIQNGDIYSKGDIS